MSEDYYKLLGVSRSASADEIQNAYRKLARKYHPDMNPDDKSAQNKFKQIQHAYEVLSNSEKRQLYDQYGSDFEKAAGGPAGWQTQGGQGFQNVDLSDLFGEGFSGGEAGGGFSDIFRQFTGRGRSGGTSRRRPQRGADIEHQLEVPFRTSVSGGDAQITVRRTGGKLETIHVKIPAGIEDGKKIRLRGQGEASPTGGQPGDILITVKVSPHPNFQRNGLDLIVKVPVTVAEAALGAKVDVPTPKGTISLTIPPGTSGGKRLRIKGHGVAVKDRTGDLLADLQIKMPETLDSESQEFIRQLDERNPLQPRSNLAW